MRSLVILIIAVCSLQAARGQSFWEIGTRTYGNLCSVHPLLWFLPQTCKTYGGTVSCSLREASLNKIGHCLCNLGEAAYFDKEALTCLGKVGSPCTSEYTGFIPPKLCTPNADCVPEANKGHSVGKCTCVYGYVPTVYGLCIKDASIGDEQRSTPRTTTTTEPATKPPFELPTTKPQMFGESCWKGEGTLLSLNSTSCESYGSTVACIASPTPDDPKKSECQCNLGADNAVFDTETNTCVSRAGSYCLANPTLLGYKVCTKGADCFPVDDGSFEDYTFGTCECLDGYIETPEGACEADPNEPNPATPRATTVRVITRPETTTRIPGELVGDGNVDNAATPISIGVLSLLFATILSLYNIQTA